MRVSQLLDAARREATTVLLDRRLFLLEEGAYERFAAALDKAPASNQGEGLGRALIQGAVVRTQQAAAIGGIRAIVALALSEPTRRFYEGCGFAASPVDPTTLMVGIADMEKILTDR